MHASLSLFELGLFEILKKAMFGTYGVLSPTLLKYKYQHF